MVKIKKSGLLDNTHSSFLREYEPEESWNYFDVKADDPQFHRGLYGLAKILGLQENAYKQVNIYKKQETD